MNIYIYIKYNSLRKSIRKKQNDKKLETDNEYLHFEQRNFIFFKNCMRMPHASKFAIKRHFQIQLVRVRIFILKKCKLAIFINSVFVLILTTQSKEIIQNADNNV